MHCPLFSNLCTGKMNMFYLRRPFKQLKRVSDLNFLIYKIGLLGRWYLGFFGSLNVLIKKKKTV